MSTDLLKRVTPNLRGKNGQYTVACRPMCSSGRSIFSQGSMKLTRYGKKPSQTPFRPFRSQARSPAPSTETITLPGNIEAWFQAPIYAQVSGYVKMWYKDYGAQVKKGDVLAEINTPTLDAQYSQAKAALEAERAKYNLAVVTAERWTALRKSHAVSEQEISVQDANMKAETAQLEAAEHNVNNFEAKLQFKTIVAPYDGVVTARNINVGDYVNKDGNISDKDAVTNLFSVADIHKLRLFISVPEAFGHILKPGLDG